MNFLRTALAATVFCVTSGLCAPIEKCGTVMATKTLGPGRYSMVVFVEREMNDTRYYFEDYQNGGVPNECLTLSALGTNICFDVTRVRGREGEFETISDCRVRR